tara:strand:+ start:938 stop:1120 length:183 start_codon:yes stop_codon:yes gene_type:complete
MEQETITNSPIYPTTHVGMAIMSLEGLLTDANHHMTEVVRNRLIGVLADLLTAQRKLMEA